MRCACDFAEATARFGAAIEIDPNFPVPYSGMSRLNARRGDIAEARRWIDLAIEHAPTRAFYFARKGMLLLQLGEVEEAVACIETACSRSPDNLYDSDLAVALYIVRNDRPMLELVHSGATTGCRHFPRAQRAQASIALGDHATARELYEQHTADVHRDIGDLINDDWIWRLPHAVNRAHLLLDAGDARGRTELEELIAACDEITARASRVRRSTGPQRARGDRSSRARAATPRGSDRARLATRLVGASRLEHIESRRRFPVSHTARARLSQQNGKSLDHGLESGPEKRLQEARCTAYTSQTGIDCRRPCAARRSRCLRPVWLDMLHRPRRRMRWSSRRWGSACRRGTRCRRSSRRAVSIPRTALLHDRDATLTPRASIRTRAPSRSFSSASGSDRALRRAQVLEPSSTACSDLAPMHRPATPCWSACWKRSSIAPRHPERLAGEIERIRRTYSAPRTRGRTS
jgi:tetratricopeptide (TPR) repeat protein